MPCLNEAETLEKCIGKAQRAFRELKVAGEIVVADNGSVDASREIARRLGATVVEVAGQGYGNALRGGVTASRGAYVVMGDADDSYDFSSLAPFLEELRRGRDLVVGNRFKGKILPGAMPWKHRWIGNPVLTAVGRLLFRSPVGDFHCGLRAFRREAFDRMDLRTTGMEFASEMVIKSTLLGMRVSEVPVVLSKDGRSRPPHLRSWRDGWRHLRFMLLFSPLWLFVIPGATLALVGLVGGLYLLGGPRRVGGVEFDVHTLLIASMMTVVGYQVVVFGLFSKMFAIAEGLHPNRPILQRLQEGRVLEGGLAAGGILVLAGLALVAWAVERWRHAEFGSLNVQVTMRQVIPAVTLVSLGVQTLFASFFLGVLGLGRRA